MWSISEKLENYPPHQTSFQATRRQNPTPNFHTKEPPNPLRVPLAGSAGGQNPGSPLPGSEGQNQFLPQPRQAPQTMMGQLGLAGGNANADLETSFAAKRSAGAATALSQRSYNAKPCDSDFGCCIH